MNKRFSSLLINSGSVGKGEVKCSSKMNTLTINELKAIADAPGVTFEQSFTLLGGTQLKIDN